MQKTLDTLIGGKQKLLKIEYSYTFLLSITQLMCQINWIKIFCDIFRVDWDFNFSALHKFGYGDKFIHMVKNVYTNMQCKIKINGLLLDPFTLTGEFFLGWLFSMLLYIISAEVLASFINVNKWIRGIQIGDYEKKALNFADDINISSRDITCLIRIQVFLKLYEDASSSRTNFSKCQASVGFPLGHLELTLVTLFSIAPNGTKSLKI